MTVALLSCNDNNPIHLPKVDILESKTHSKRGVFYVNDTVFSGTVYSLYPHTKDTSFIQNYLEGKKHGVWKQLYPNGQPKEIRYFTHGKKQGEYNAWWMDGQKRLSYYFVDGEYQGTCCEWNQSGILIKKMTYEQGYEEGPQKMWYDNGIIKSNYVMRGGRRYGLLGTKNCTNVSDSIFSR